MNNFVIFGVGLAVTLIAGMGVITSTVFMGYNYPPKEEKKVGKAVYQYQPLGEKLKWEWEVLR